MVSRKTTKIITKCGFKTKAGNTNVHSVAFNELTDDEVSALINALMLYRTVSAFAQDLSDYLLYALLQTIASADKAIADKAEGFVKKLNSDLGLEFVRHDDLEQMRKELIELREKVKEL
jgi:hypothetical protein